MIWELVIWSQYGLNRGKSGKCTYNISQTKCMCVLIPAGALIPKDYGHPGMEAGPAVSQDASGRCKDGGGSVTAPCEWGPVVKLSQFPENKTED